VTTYLFCDDDPDKLVDIPRKVGNGISPWNHVPDGTALPAAAIERFATALAGRSSLPDVVLIDDQVEFSRGEQRQRNGTRTMAAFTRLLMTFPRIGEPDPAFVLLTHVDPDPCERLTFMEFGGTAIADRQDRFRDVPRAIEEAINAARAGETAWRPPMDRPVLGRVHGSRDFWRDLFPLLPLLDDAEATDSRLIKEHLRLGEGAQTLSRRKKQERERLNDRKTALSRQIANGLSELHGERATVNGDAEIVNGARQLGLLWIVERRRRQANDIPWTDLAPGLAGQPIAALALRSDHDQAARLAWYRHPDDPRRTAGASHYPSPWGLPSS
jgi:hypothetical protein